MNLVRSAATIVAAALLSGCYVPKEYVLDSDELVMKPGDVIELRAPGQNMRIEAPSALTRRIFIGESETTVYLAALHQPEYGALGGEGSGGGLNVREQSYDFASARDLQFYLTDRKGVRSSDGLRVNAGTAPNGTGYVEVTRLCVAHRPPQALEPTPHSRIAWSHADPVPAVRAWYGCARSIYDPVAADESELRADIDGTRWVNVVYSAPRCPLNSDAGDSEPAGIARPVREDLALLPGSRLELHNDNGTLTIDAPDDTTRVLHWRNTRSNYAGLPYDTEARTIAFDLAAAARPWPAQRGAVACGRRSGDGNYAVTFRETQLNFADAADFKAWMHWAENSYLFLDSRYSPNGLLAGFHVGVDARHGPALAVDAIRFCIGGKPPHRLAGASRQIVASGPEKTGAPCPAEPFDVAGTYARARHDGLTDTPLERRIRAYRGR
jgi:hypothetical protein